ncbi:trichohyalin-like [Carassius gibelio]|uniref:trichohyalin-like n=1 Tax=Carassius gibelio TaxID=101364 RepID=UPI0022791FE1|nr:trichohyalin-like [Carassius gibelio]
MASFKSRPSPPRSPPEERKRELVRREKEMDEHQEGGEMSASAEDRPGMSSSEMTLYTDKKWMKRKGLVLKKQQESEHHPKLESHTEGIKGYLTKKESDGVLRQKTWPPQSPDLNPIQMVRGELDRRQKAKGPTSAKHLSGNSFKTVGRPFQEERTKFSGQLETRNKLLEEARRTHLELMELVRREKEMVAHQEGDELSASAEDRPGMSSKWMKRKGLVLKKQQESEHHPKLESHTEGIKGYLTKKESDGVLRQKTWPPQSPDLNPIQMVRGELDRRQKAKGPTSAKHLSGNSFKTVGRPFQEERTKFSGQLETRNKLLEEARRTHLELMELVRREKEMERKENELERRAMELDEREEEMDRRERELERRAMELVRREKEMDEHQEGGEMSASAEDRPGMSSGLTCQEKMGASESHARAQSEAREMEPERRERELNKTVMEPDRRAIEPDRKEMEPERGEIELYKSETDPDIREGDLERREKELKQKEKELDKRLMNQQKTQAGWCIRQILGKREMEQDFLETELEKTAMDRDIKVRQPEKRAIEPIITQRELDRRAIELDRRAIELDRRAIELDRRAIDLHVELNRRGMEMDIRQRETEKRAERRPTELDKRLMDLHGRQYNLYMRDREEMNLDVREIELKKGVMDPDMRHREMERKEMEPDIKERGLDIRESELDRRENEMERRESEMERRMSELDRRPEGMKPVRSSSNELYHPNMSESEDKSPAILNGN